MQSPLASTPREGVCLEKPVDPSEFRSAVARLDATAPDQARDG
jgi:hypothetical protein